MSRRPTVLVAVLSLLLATLGGAALATPASAATGVSVTGTLYTSDYSTPLGGVTVTLEDSTTFAPVSASVTTGQYGDWAIADVADGDYVVHYSGLFDGYANGGVPSDQAAVITVDVTNGDASLFDTIDPSVYSPPPAFRIRIQDPAGNALSLCPTFYPDGNVDNGTGGSCTFDAATGDTTGWIPAGTYTVRAADDAGTFAPTWLGGSSAATATRFTVVAGATTEFGTLTMIRAGSISVVVKRADKRIAVGQDEACLVVYVKRTQEYAGEACTDARGVALVTGVAPGSYSLYAQANTLDYVGRWAGDLIAQTRTPLFSVRASTTTKGGTISLPLAGRITGVVTDKSTGLPLSGYCASIGSYSFLGGEDGSRTFTETSCTGADGRYLIRGADVGSYKVEIVPSIFNQPEQGGFAVGFFGGTSNPTAEEVPVSNGRLTSRIDVALVPEGTLSGTVHYADGTLPTDTMVYAFDAVSGTNVGLGEAYDGQPFTVRGLNTGSLILRFETEGGSPVYWDGTPDGTPDKSRARAVRTRAGKALTGFDLVVPNP
jgi:hypothetical protein